MIEWPDDEAEPTKYWLSTLPPETAIEDLVKTTKLRWRIERDYQDLKQELGLGHYEGRGWRSKPEAPTRGTRVGVARGGAASTTMRASASPPTVS